MDSRLDSPFRHFVAITRCLWNGIRQLFIDSFIWCANENARANACQSTISGASNASLTNLEIFLMAFWFSTRKYFNEITDAFFGCALFVSFSSYLHIKKTILFSAANEINVCALLPIGLNYANVLANAERDRPKITSEQNMISIFCVAARHSALPSTAVQLHSHNEIMNGEKNR